MSGVAPDGSPVDVYRALLRRELSAAGLRFERWLAEDRGWFAATPETA